MVKGFLIAAILCIAAAPLFAAGSDGFAYPDGNLYGNGDWVKGNATSWIQVNAGRIEVKGGDTGSGRSTGNIVIGQGMTGVVVVDVQVMGDGVGGSTTWGLCVDDSTKADFADGNLAKWYGTTNNARGRIDGTANVTGAYDLSGPGVWDNLRMILNTNAGTVEFFLNGASIGTLNNGLPGAAIGRVSFQQISNANGAGKSIFLDNLSVQVVPEPSSLAALGVFAAGLAGFVRRRTR